MSWTLSVTGADKITACEQLEKAKHAAYESVEEAVEAQIDTAIGVVESVLHSDAVHGPVNVYLSGHARQSEQQADSLSISFSGVVPAPPPPTTPTPES